MLLKTKNAILADSVFFFIFPYFKSFLLAFALSSAVKNF